ncbi:unnamed protein product [Soboliphyme baturini]|uniref:Calreticulin n=1 Tax=Soboliphyme baturini TaxID=241478 RepID=A0A183ISD6_9BILA|nr:unnamed protein product [Soboliphyme baturini]
MITVSLSSFADVPLVLQYDVKFQNGQECGGSYVKLLTDTATLDLKNFHDKTAFTIMFGPDKCGIESKVHFIIRFKNPVTGQVKEHMAKQSDKGLDTYFSDKMSHLWTLVLLTDGNYRVFVDQKELMRGNLLDLEIPDPNSKKPDDWDEAIPEFIEDVNAVKPTDWLEDESEYVPSDTAKKPEDWDEDMDGKWEPPQIKNPKCATVSGCGKWTPPKIKNPAYKGKWTPPMIPNPNFKGKWTPRLIDNPEYFEIENVFRSLEPIAAIGLELWTMTDDIFFDDFLLCDDKKTADRFAAGTWLIKHSVENQVASNNESFFENLIQVANKRPWLWAVYLLVILIPLIVITIFCCGSSKVNCCNVACIKFSFQDATAIAKKTDKYLPDVQESLLEDESQDREFHESESIDSQRSEASKEKHEEESWEPSFQDSNAVTVIVMCKLIHFN